VGQEKSVRRARWRRLVCLLDSRCALGPSLSGCSLGVRYAAGPVVADEREVSSGSADLRACEDKGGVVDGRREGVTGVVTGVGLCSLAVDQL